MLIDDALGAIEGLDFLRAEQLLADVDGPPAEVAAARRLLDVLRQLNSDDPVRGAGAPGAFERAASEAPRTWALIQRLEPELTAHGFARFAAEQRRLGQVVLAMERRERVGPSAPRHLLVGRERELELLERLARVGRLAFLQPGAAAAALRELRRSDLAHTSLGRRLGPWWDELEAGLEARAQGRDRRRDERGGGG